MPKVRARIPVAFDVTESQLDLLVSAAKLVRKIREHAPQLVDAARAGRLFLAEADAIIARERSAKTRKNKGSGVR